MSGTVSTATGPGPWVAETYRYVRLITPLPAIWLLLAITSAAVWRQELLDSISDYYGGPLRDVFVGTLMASAVGMIAYKGHSRLEDYALNFAGVNAVFVALVPNSFTALLDATRAAEVKKVPVVVSSADLLQNLKISVVVLLVVGAAFVAVDIAVMHWTTFRWRDQTSLANALIVTSWGTELVLLLLVLGMLGGQEHVAGRTVFALIHFVAAALLVVNLSFAAASHAFPGRLRRQGIDAPQGTARVQTSFRVITVLMWAGIVVGGLLIGRGVSHAVIATEAVEIILFIAFWVIATRTEWERG